MLEQKAGLREGNGCAGKRDRRVVERIKDASRESFKEFGRPMIESPISICHAIANLAERIGPRLAPIIPCRRLSNEGTEHVIDCLVTSERPAVACFVGTAAVLIYLQHIVHHRLDVLRMQESFNAAIFGASGNISISYAVI